MYLPCQTLSNMALPSEQTLLVTGANGYIAGLIIKLALEKGYKVKGSVRTESSADKLKTQFHEYAAQLSTVLVPDIVTIDSFEDAWTRP